MPIKHSYQTASANSGANEVSATRWNDAHTVDVAIDLPDNTVDPAAPASGIKLYSKTLGGRRLPYFIDPANVGRPLQGAFFGLRIAIWNPNAGTSPNTLGLASSIAATLSHPPLNTTSLAGSIYRMRFQTSTAAGNASGIRDNVASVWRGVVAGRGGFFLHQRICSGDIALGSSSQFFSGLTSQNALLAGEPSALPDVLGLGKNASDVNWQFMHRSGVSVVVKENLGLAYAINQTLDLIMFAAPGANAISVKILNYAFDGTATTLLDASYSTSIPLPTVFLARKHEVRNAANAAAVNFDLVKSYLESNF